MNRFYGLLRFCLTRLFYRALGIRVDYWRREVVDLWNLSPEERRSRLDRHLAENPLRDANGGSVTQLTQVEQAPRLSRQALREGAAASGQQEGAAKAGLRFARHTAGTTGAPTHLTLNRTELSRMLGVRDYCFLHYSIRLGEAEARIWGQPDAGLKARLRDFLLNRRIYYPGGQGAEAEVRSLVQSRPAYIYGYSSLILEAARIIEEKGWQPPTLRCVICTAETVLPSQKRYMERIFQAPVAEEYGATEFDIVAFECQEGHRHLVNPWLVVEEDDGQALVTDLSRASQSFVRYELGDALSLCDGGCGLLGGAWYVDELEGRSINRFAYISETEKFHSVRFAQIVNAYQKQFDDSFSFTVGQENYGCFTVSTSPRPRHGAGHLVEYIKAELESELGKSLSIEAARAWALQDGEKRGYFLQRMELKQ